MPPSFDHDNTSTPSTSPPRKSTQKGLGAGGSTSKNNKKNGQTKDNGGVSVLAAVTKNAARMSKQPSKSVETPIESPEMAPVDAPPLRNLPVTSLLDVLSSATIARSSTQNTDEWAKNVPAYSTSPNNLINLGESPPTLPSSYDERLAGFGWTKREQRGPVNGHIASASPPSRRRPLSYQTDGNYPQVFDDHRSQVSSYVARRSSMYSQHPRYAQNPPLPHQPQPHFYGAPDPDLLLSPPGPGLVPGDNGFYCGFDSIPTSQDASTPPDKVILCGYEGGLDIHTVTKRGLVKNSSLEGLRGGVFHAKVLWNVLGGASQSCPFIAVVVHGPVLPSGGSSSGEDTGPSADGISVAQNESVRGSPSIPSRAIHENDASEYYQTTVEVYSLVTKQYVTTLLSLPKIRLPIPSTSSLFKAPTPVGSLTIRADSPYVVIASGATGETWLYRLQVSPSSIFGEARCIAKVWTTVQHGVSVDSSNPNGSADGDWYSAEPVERKQYKASILSISGRWLAYCPCALSSQVSLRAQVPGITGQAKIPGLHTQAPPQLPSVNCLVETPGGESVVKQIMQAGTQALIEGTTYIGKHIGKQGAHVWNSYWNKSSQAQPTPGPASYPNQTTVNYQFPPTHGVPTQAPATAKEPGLVSILDLESLSQHAPSSASPHPLATFKIPHGCSFLSFAPSGLALFTASSKGDVQSVWDLMRLQYAKSSFLKGAFQGADIRGPHVRQIAQFSRMTIARIVDVVWSSPHGERAVMVTEPGTVHILDLPASAFIWPPPRRRGTSQKPTESNGEPSGSSLSAASVATTAVSSLWTVARRARRQSSSGGISAKTVTAQAGQGTQALAAGISRSVGAATGRMNEIRKAGSTKLQLPRSSSIPSKSCIVLLNNKRNDTIIVVAGGIVRSYTIKNRRADRPTDRQKASHGAKYLEFRLPSLPDLKPLHDMTRDLGQVTSDLELAEGDVVGQQWAPKKLLVVTSIQGTESSIPQAEIESNAPYQPFHTDRRVGLYIFSASDTANAEPSVSILLSPPPVWSTALVSDPLVKGPWAFGGKIKTTKLDVGPARVVEDEELSLTDHRPLPPSAMERVLMVKDNNEDSEQIVITTRRRKGAVRSGVETADADEGFFEDDCEVLDFASQRV
ncbi:hypothetical protein BJ875DRAFT_278032 [Amylocarpus encephaloides]|uniref:Uncharacterized protein n=1 Tax=Amylocarpus encephaloides TaxID=45428 RepID=A0A9P8C657_9HELO|nr:hypothetical protein BJ875DRAFT_278032 [Amylocarpus encephaloides]